MKFKISALSYYNYEILSIQSGSRFIPIVVEGYPFFSKKVYVLSKNMPDLEALALSSTNFNKADIITRSYKKIVDKLNFHELKNNDHISYGGVSSIDEAKDIINLYKKLEFHRKDFYEVKVVERV